MENCESIKSPRRTRDRGEMWKGPDVTIKTMTINTNDVCDRRTDPSALCQRLRRAKHES